MEQMSETLWARRSPPELDVDAPTSWAGEPATAADLTALRRRLCATLADGIRPAATTDDDTERLLLVFEELVSNGLRHGRGPIRVTVSSTGAGWLLEVSDAAPDRPPRPAVARDPAAGGLGLYMVAELAAAHGWMARGERKSVWARVDVTSVATPLRPSLPHPRDKSGGPDHRP
jgi:anti-sigma regulatory factor (Ser/Thr protein kinase)